MALASQPGRAYNLDLAIAATDLALAAELRGLGRAAAIAAGSILVLEGPPAVQRVSGPNATFHRLSVVVVPIGLGLSSLSDLAVERGWKASARADRAWRFEKGRFELAVHSRSRGPRWVSAGFWKRLSDSAISGAAPIGDGLCVPALADLALYHAAGCFKPGVDAIEAYEDLITCLRANGWKEVRRLIAVLDPPADVLGAVDAAAKGEPWTPKESEPPETPVAPAARHAFRGLEIEVPGSVFRPMALTDELVDRCLEACLSVASPIVVDVGTGSGAIALAVASERPDAKVYALEFDGPSFAAVRRNRDRLGVTTVNCERGFLLDPVLATLSGSATAVVSNVPFAPPHMPFKGTQGGPRGAYVGAGHDGLLLLRRLAADARSVLLPGGVLILQVGSEQLARVEGLLGELGYGPPLGERVEEQGRPIVVSVRWPGEAP